MLYAGAGEVGQVDALAAQFDLSGFEAGEVEEGVGYPVHPAGLFVDGGGGALLDVRRGSGAVDEGLREALDGRERRAQVVRDVGDEVALGLLAGLDVVGHIVEGFGESLDFFRSGDGRAGVQVAVGQSFCRLGDFAQRAGDGAADEEGQEHAQYQGDEPCLGQRLQQCGAEALQKLEDRGRSGGDDVALCFAIDGEGLRDDEPAPVAIADLAAPGIVVAAQTREDVGGGIGIPTMGAVEEDALVCASAHAMRVSWRSARSSSSAKLRGPGSMRMAFAPSWRRIRLMTLRERMSSSRKTTRSSSGLCRRMTRREVLTLHRTMRMTARKLRMRRC